jgi:transcriptional regulator with XRE-family HTH domain
MTRTVPTSLSLRLGAKVAKVRRSKGLTQERVEQLTGLHQGYLSRIEHGLILPGLETLVDLAKVFDTTVSRLLSGIEDGNE